MKDFFQCYRQLICDKNQLDLLRSATSMADFLATLKQLWSCAELDDRQLIQTLQLCNQQPLDVPADQLAGHWFAASYRQQMIGWCSPCGPATEGFQDQYISRCQQQLLNQLVRPRTSLQSLLATELDDPAPKPAGFIFHLSRCGSTLISGCLSEFAQTNLLSEPPAISELLLDSSLSFDEQMQAISKLLQMQTLAIPECQQLVIKWNAWDMLRWQAIRTRYPQVPVVLLVRDPLEIIASHERQAGRHMAGDLAMKTFHPVFEFSADANPSAGLLVNRVQVLRALLEHMQQVAGDAGIMLVDYRELNPQSIQQIASFFNLPLTSETHSRLSARMQVHSKEPALQFQADTARKREHFGPEQRNYIAQQLGELYQQLFDSAALRVENQRGYIASAN